MMTHKIVPGCCIYGFAICFLLYSTSAVDEHHGQEPAESNNTHGNGTESIGHGNDTDEGGHHEEEAHHPGHYVVWPSAIGMMVFISGVSFLFYHFYSKANMKKVAMEHKHQLSFFQDVIVSSTVAGFAAPGIISSGENSKTMKPEKSGVLQSITEEPDDVFEASATDKVE